MNRTAISSILLLSALFAVSCNPNKETLFDEEEEVTRSIENSIGWALEKDTTLLYNIISNDADLLIINPDPAMIEGIKAFREITNTLWMNPKFKATHY